MRERQKMLSFWGGLLLPKIIHGCAWTTLKVWLSLHQFFAKLPTHQYTILIKSTQYCRSWIFFTTVCSKYTQVFEFGLLHLWWNPLHSGYTKLHKKVAQQGSTWNVHWNLALYGALVLTSRAALSPDSIAPSIYPLHSTAVSVPAKNTLPCGSRITLWVIGRRLQN